MYRVALRARYDGSEHYRAPHVMLLALQIQGGRAGGARLYHCRVKNRMTLSVATAHTTSYTHKRTPV